MFRRTALAVMALVICCLSGCGLEQGAWIYIDNGHTSPMIVQMDGTTVATVAPYSFERFAAKGGEHKITITCGGETIYDETKTVEESNNFFSPTRYMLNPGATNRYWVYKVYYYQYESDYEQALIESDDYLEEFSGIQEDYALVPPTDWFQIPGDPYILEPSPDELIVDDDQRVTIEEELARIPFDAYQILKTAKATDRPSESQYWAIYDAYYDNMME